MTKTLSYLANTRKAWVPALAQLLLWTLVITQTIPQPIAVAMTEPAGLVLNTLITSFLTWLVPNAQLSATD
jgi:hypothetical protein